LLDELVPLQEWHELESGDEGLLYVPGAWGGAISWTRAYGENSSRTYWFSFDRSSPYVIYFSSSGEGENFLTNWAVPVTNGEQQAYFNAAMFTPETPNPWGLSKDAHVVSVVPNDGKGGHGLHFVATEVTVLDGTLGYPTDPVATLDALRARFDTLASAVANSFDAEFDKARAAADPGEATETPLSDNVSVWPTWLTTQRRIQATFVRTLEGAWEYSKTITPVPPECPDGAPCLPPPPPYDVIVRHVFGVQYAAVLEADASGAIVSETEAGPRAIPAKEEQRALGDQ
jgi:hypothetical protein